MVNSLGCKESSNAMIWMFTDQPLFLHDSSSKPSSHLKFSLNKSATE